MQRRKPADEPGADDAGGSGNAATTSTPAVVKPAAKKEWHDHVRLDYVAMALLTLFCSGLLFWFSRTPPPHERIFIKQDLALYDGKRGPMYLALLGEVFDVSKKPEFYGEGGGYSFFVGKDASRGFITGKFKEDQNDDIRDLGNGAFKALVDWRNFYRTEYKYMGRVVGRFYWEDGKRTKLLDKVEAGAKQAEADEQKKVDLEKLFPSCSMRWSEADGGTVWCDDGKYPRKIFQQLPGGQPTTRCACFVELGWSDMRQVYAGCKPDAHRCKVQQASKAEHEQGKAAAEAESLAARAEAEAEAARKAAGGQGDAEEDEGEGGEVGFAGQLEVEL